MQVKFNTNINLSRQNFKASFDNTSETKKAKLLQNINPIGFDALEALERIPDKDVFSVSQSALQIKHVNKKNINFNGAEEEIYKEPMNFKTKGLYKDAKITLEPKAHEFYMGLQKVVDDFNVDKYYKLSHTSEPVVGFGTYIFGSVFRFLRIPTQAEPAYTLGFKEDGGKEQTIVFEDKTLKASFNPKDYGTSLNELASIGLEAIISDNNMLNTEERLKMLIQNAKRDAKNDDAKIRKEMKDILSALNELKTQLVSGSNKDKEALLEEIYRLQTNLSKVVEQSDKHGMEITKIENSLTWDPIVARWDSSLDTAEYQKKHRKWYRNSEGKWVCYYS